MIVDKHCQAVSEKLVILLQQLSFDIFSKAMIVLHGKMIIFDMPYRIVRRCLDDEWAPN